MHPSIHGQRIVKIVPDLSSQAVECLGSQQTLTASSGAALRELILPWVDSANQSEQGALWPLVHRLELRGPWAALAPGAPLPLAAA